MVKRFLVIAIVLLVVSGGMVSGSGQSESAPAEPELELWLLPFVDNVQESMGPLFDVFTAETGIQVNVTVLSYAEALTQIQTAIAAGQGPDVVYLTDGRYMPLVEFGAALEPLDDYISQDFLSRYVDSELVDQYRWDGELHVVPFGFVTYLWAINTDMFAESDVDPEIVERMRSIDAEWTWDDLERVLDALTRDTDGDGRVDQWGYAYPGGSAWLHPFPLWLWNAGGEVFDRDGTPLLGGPETTTALSFLLRMQDQGWMPPGAETMAPPDAIDAFATGRTGVINNVWPANGLFVWPEQFPDLNYELVYPPVGPNGDRTTYFGGALLGILRQSQQKEAAWQLIEYFTSSAVQQWLSDTGFFPVTGELSESMANDPDVQKYFDVLPFSVPEPRDPKTGIVQSIYNSETQAVMTGQKSPEEATSSMRQRIEQEAF
jgi:multiple sugar transport system substrate-binding protein